MENRSLLAAALSAGLLVAATASADGSRTFEVTVINATPGQVFSPPVLVSHNSSVELFELGAPALPELAIVAEDGAGGPLVDLAASLAAVTEAQSTASPIPPGGTATYTVVADADDVLTVVSMLVNTNDAFFALNGVGLPQRTGESVSYRPIAYDAGSEGNNEDCAFVPGPACAMGSGNARSTEDAEGFVHVHNGIHGIADLGPSAYDWRNPVTQITVTRTR